MRPEIEQLLVIQERDRKIRIFDQELTRAPLERAEAEQKRLQSTANLDAAKLHAKDVEVARKKLELEAQSKRDSIAKFQTQKFQTKKNEEFQALNNEISRYENDIRDIEDRELESMELAEIAKVALLAAEDQSKQIKAQVERQIQDIAAKVEVVSQQLAEVQKIRDSLVQSVDEDLLDTYNHLFKNKGEAVVALEHENCAGCHMKVTTQTIVKVKGGREIIHCEQCGRILYLAP
jgi:hypothetical protein